MPLDTNHLTSLILRVSAAVANCPPSHVEFAFAIVGGEPTWECRIAPYEVPLVSWRRVVRMSANGFGTTPEAAMEDVLKMAAIYHEHGYEGY
jgi:hypothetical protein